MLVGDACKASWVPLVGMGVHAIVAPRDDTKWYEEGDDVRYGDGHVLVVFDDAPVPRKGTVARRMLDALKGVKKAYAAVVPTDSTERASLRGLEDLPVMTMAEFNTELRAANKLHARVKTTDWDGSPRCNGLRVNMWDDVPAQYRDLLWPTGIPTYRCLPGQ